MQSRELRKAFTDYFIRFGHVAVPSASLIPQDPTLLFTNAGMVPFKDIFLGEEKPQYIRATSIQKCLRVGGKHNDFDEVGYTRRHHTFFEMMGNFSFGDYFKTEAIEFAYTFIWKELKLNPERLYVTVYYKDSESYDIWKTLIPETRIIKIKTEDNFWRMGELGPCGPCTEIFYDHGAQLSGGLPGTPNESGDRYTEIWNLVFMQYNQTESELHTLGKPYVDTGMGLARITAVMEGVADNFETDLFMPIIKHIQAITHTHTVNIHQKVIADHLRSAVMLLGEGLQPSNVGRGYVLRRIIRRAMRHGYAIKQPIILSKLVSGFIESMAPIYPELDRVRDFIKNQLQTEESIFQDTLAKGVDVIGKYIQKHPNMHILPGKEVFTLYDTHGFPADLTRDLLKERNIDTDMEGFERCMQVRKQDSKQHWRGSGDSKQLAVFYTLDNTVPVTEFVGYEVIQSDSIVQAVFDIPEHSTTGVVLDRTPFYAESGGQIGDTGRIESAEGVFVVTDTKKTEGKRIVHIGYFEVGTFTKDTYVVPKINNKRRIEIKAHHTSAHLLHAVLQSIYGSKAVQKGSQIYPDSGRLDIALDINPTEGEIIQIEREVNHIVQDNIPLTVQCMTADKAVQSGAMALFGEKYEDTVRVITVKDEHTVFSSELCGGTHVNRTGDIGSFYIKEVFSIARGVRRFVFVATHASILYAQAFRKQVYAVEQVLQVHGKNVVPHIVQLQETIKTMRRQVEQAQQNRLKDSVETIAIDEFSLFLVNNHSLSPKEQKGFVDQLIDKKPNRVALLFRQENLKISFLLATSKDFTPTAKILLQPILKAIQATGGGTDTMVMGGGTNPEGKKQAIEMIIKMLKNTN